MDTMVVNRLMEMGVDFDMATFAATEATGSTFEEKLMSAMTMLAMV